MSRIERGIGFQHRNPISLDKSVCRLVLATVTALLAILITGYDAGEAGAADSRPNVATVDPTNGTSAAPDAAMLLAIAKLEARSQSRVNGELHFRQQSNVVRIVGLVSGLTPGLHGLHIHEVGDCSADDASSAGEHYATSETPHGAPTQVATDRHAGDLGNIIAGADGVAAIDLVDIGFSIGVGANSVLDRAIVIHSEADDLLSQPSGNAGNRIACGVIRQLALDE
jgi:Cu-Zn family superoxide dismutase